jgi:hypothetical protein
MEKVVIFDTSLVSENNGDKIIMDYCTNILDEIFPDDFFVHVPTHDTVGKKAYKYCDEAKYRIVCGTNLISNSMNKNRQWSINLLDTKHLNDICLLGVGWWQYHDLGGNFSKLYSSKLLKKALSSKLLHSVRDSYTEKKLRAMGFNNVINTTCPTMWNLTPSFCDSIPTKKANKVLTTVTDYHKNEDADKWLFQILLDNYDTVYIWIQSLDDYAYACKLFDNQRIKIVSPNIRALDRVLSMNDIDYCGTRLHAGIRALNHGKRTIIIANDNRAREISRDTGLIIVEQEKIAENLKNLITREFETKITLPFENIEKWKAQFQ